MFCRIRYLLLFITLFLGACALTDSPEPSPTPLPLLLTPPPEIVVSGSCDDSRTLEQWLQRTNRVRDPFVELMNAAVGKSRDAVHGDARTMADYRYALGNITAPDCAEQGHRFLIDATNIAVDAFRRYANGELADVHAELAESERLFTIFDGVHAGLVERLDNQLQAEREQ